MPLSILKVQLNSTQEFEIKVLKVVGLIDITYMDKKGRRKSVINKTYELLVEKAYLRSNIIKSLESGTIGIKNKSEFYEPARAIMELGEYTTDPIIPMVAPKNKKQLSLYYIEALNVAKDKGCKNILLPMISGKTCGCSYEEALSLTISAIRGWLATNEMNILLLVYRKRIFSPPKSLLRDIEAFFDNHYEFRTNPIFNGILGKLLASDAIEKAEEEGKKNFYSHGRYIRLADSYIMDESARGSDPDFREVFEEYHKKIIEELGEKLDDSFSIALIDLINAKGKTAVEIYKRANIDRKLFSKIRNEFYIPGKRTSIALAVALELSLDETNRLLKRAGYTLSRSLIFDVIIEYFISQGKYDIYEINNVLFSYDQPILGG